MSSLPFPPLPPPYVAPLPLPCDHLPPDPATCPSCDFNATLAQTERDRAALALQIVQLATLNEQGRLDEQGRAMIRHLYGRMGREGLEAWDEFDRRWTERLGEVDVGGVGGYGGGMGTASTSAAADARPDGMNGREQAGAQDRSVVMSSSAGSGGRKAKEGAAGAGRIGG